METVIKATNFAAIAHKFQKRKDADQTPYINHPIEVMTLLSIGGVKDINILSAAVLHDTIEDTKTTIKDLENLFGKDITNLVLECSDDKSLTKVERKKLQLEHCRDVSVGAKLIKASDKLSNLSGLAKNPPVIWSKEEIDGYFAWSYGCWLNLRGHNEYLDSELSKIFSEQKLMDIAKNDLDLKLGTYYTHIDKSE